MGAEAEFGKLQERVRELEEKVVKMQAQIQRLFQLCARSLIGLKNSGGKI